MKKNLLLTLAVVLVCFALVFAGCTPAEENPPANDDQNVEDVNTNEDVNNENNADNEVTETQYIDKADVKAVIDEAQEGYVLLDLRKAADYEAGHIVTAISADVDSAVSNADNDTATANLQAALEAATGDTLGGDSNLVLICYSGKKYAETATGLLKDMGVAATQIYTLEGGHNGWAEDADYTSYIVEGAEPGALAE